MKTGIKRFKTKDLKTFIAKSFHTPHLNLILANDGINVTHNSFAKVLECIKSRSKGQVNVRNDNLDPQKVKRKLDVLVRCMKLAFLFLCYVLDIGFINNKCYSY